MKILRRYKYDPLDRLAGLQAQEQAFTQRFYQENDLVTELGEEDQQTIFRHGEQPLAQRQILAGATDTLLMATDQAHSVLQTLSPTRREHMAYSAYGHRPAESGLSSLLGFNGECLDGITGHYLLGQGKRAFNPVLMRFNSPDELSPFGEGGINSYAYCEGDPINRYDPTGNNPLYLFRFWNFNPKQLFRPWANELKALDLSSVTIKQTNLTALSPTSRPPIVFRPTASTSTQASPDFPFKGALPETKVRPERSKNPAANVRHYRRLRAAGQEYDNYVEHHPGFEPRITKKLLKKLKKHKDKASDKDTPKDERIKAKSRATYVELEIKQYNIRRNKDSNPK
jgi:RHS repeat-associated protein